MTNTALSLSARRVRHVRGPLRRDWRRDSIQAVLDADICCGCGACLSSCPTDCLSLTFGDRFNFPVVDESNCIACKKCLAVCPSTHLINDTPADLGEVSAADAECYLAHAKDDSIRLDAASGGFITSLLISLLESHQIDGAVVTRSNGTNPLIAESIVGRDRESILAARSSKYSPVSACTTVSEILDRPGRYAFVGTPCMLEGLVKLCRKRPELERRIALRIGFVCSGMSSRAVTRNYLEEKGKLEMTQVHEIAYRGGGWPGRFRVFGPNRTVLMDRPYLTDSSSHVVGRDHYLRCYNCVDHFGAFSDIVASDPWSQKMVATETRGRSAVMIRSARGRKAFESLLQSGLIVAQRICVSEMHGYNPGLVIDRNHDRHIWIAVYQLIFHRRLRYLFVIISAVLKGRLTGVRTTLRAYFSKRYFY